MFCKEEEAEAYMEVFRNKKQQEFKKVQCSKCLIPKKMRAYNI